MWATMGKVRERWSCVRVKEDYLKQIQTTIDYVETHLAEELSLARLAQVARFSDYIYIPIKQKGA